MSFQLLDFDKGIFLKEANSTNSLVKQKEFSPGTWILADSQSSGKGRKGRTWTILGKESIIFSGKLRSTGDVPSPNLFSIMVGSAVAKALLSTYKNSISVNELKIKWPNDIFVRDKKVCGILIETEQEGSHWDWIVGIGINLLGDPKEIPENLPDAGFVTADPANANKKHALLETLIPLINDAALAIQRDSEPTEELSFINEHLLWKDQKVFYTEMREQKSGQLLGIDSAGRMLVRSPNGKVIEFIDTPDEFRSLE
ncbi:biotin--[acetyl-CoA-carboxylase] ligase [Leptospira perolatii]|uniref:Biotin--[acetyl-CoA-carboxylase] ligase n=1 Tax=Leptospira perolatii TaxID=2023191 RepID=A0A2M9ZSY2_9LEPT|nr:biotin--[acetyl-CoA-carboxylase] ligase [Leptospira perolatii]PJZ68770.1 biotin--[acetyl-CoA-carboxylase] ligase [Leptospira perolatii]PJZ75125.1 biotin--[acetyl-CoA-carboxylase] ligase [Leptospira perolatii]